MAVEDMDYSNWLAVGPATHPERIQQSAPSLTLELDAETDSFYRRADAFDDPSLSEAWYTKTCMELLRDEDPTIDPDKIVAVIERCRGYGPKGYTALITLPLEIGSYLTKLTRDVVNPFNVVTPGRLRAANRYHDIRNEYLQVLRGLWDSVADVPGPATKSVTDWSADAADRVMRYQDCSENSPFIEKIAEPRVQALSQKAAHAALRAARTGSTRPVSGGVLEHCRTYTAVEAVGEDTISVAPLERICEVAIHPFNKVKVRIFKPVVSSETATDTTAVTLAIDPARELQLRIPHLVSQASFGRVESDPWTLLGLDAEQHPELRSVERRLGNVVLRRLG